jgi:hypothetical protein
VINAGQDYARLRREVPSHLNVFGYIPRLIMSMHFAAQRHIVDDLRRDVRWDVVVVDEAHHMAERGSGRKLLAELGRFVAERCEALLLATATPHDGKDESFAPLIRLLNPYAVVDPDRLDPAIVRPLIVRRLKRQVVKADGSRLLRRQIHVLDVEPYRTRAERNLDRGLEEIASKSGLEESYYERLAKGMGRVIMASSRSDEESLVLRDMTNNPFTHYLLEAPRGNARTCGDGLIRILDVFDHVSEVVPACRPRIPSSRQPIWRTTFRDGSFFQRNRFTLFK